MKAYLVRVGVDLTPASGNWVAPMDPLTYRFAYVPILENEANGSKPIRRGYGTTYEEFRGVCDSFGRTLHHALQERYSHLDPDFRYLTYGDEGNRGKPLLALSSGDVLAFYASLRPVGPSIDNKLIYALIGLFVVDRVVSGKAIPKGDWAKNAHTRREPDHTDVVVSGKKGSSGRLDRCIPIGGWRDHAYRVTPELLNEWGGLSVRNGWIQRSAVLPQFCDPRRFYDWFEKKGVRLVPNNN